MLRDSMLVENPLGLIRFGKFSLVDKTMKATFSDGGTALFVIKKIRPTEMQLQRNENKNQTLLYLKSDGKPFAPTNINPYEPVRNQWCIKPKKSESAAQLNTGILKIICNFMLHSPKERRYSCNLQIT